MRKINGLEFPLIQTVDADLRISSDSVVVPRLTIGRSAATISLKGGKLVADIAELEIDDGTHGGGQLRIDTSGASPTYDIRGKLEGLDVGTAAQAVFGHPTVQGRGDVTVEVTATGVHGRRAAALARRQTVRDARRGRPLGIDVNKLVTAVNAQQGASVWPEVSTGAIAVDKLDARFAVVQGKLRTETAEALSGGRTMTAEGAIDLPERAIDVEFAIGDRTAARRRRLGKPRRGHRHARAVVPTPKSRPAAARKARALSSRKPHQLRKSVRPRARARRASCAGRTWCAATARHRARAPIRGLPR